MRNKTSSCSYDSRTITFESVNKFVAQPYNYQDATNASASSVTVDIRNFNFSRKLCGNINISHNYELDKS